MNNKLDILNKAAESTLTQKLKKLEQLEKEKKNLLEQGKIINKKDFSNYEKKLIESELKFTNLLKEVQELSKKIELLKSKMW